MSILIGIDPGLSGALALLINGAAIRVDDMPTVSENRSRTVAPAILADLLREMLKAAPAGGRAMVFIERVASMPGQGVASSFVFGKAAGVAEGVVGALGLPYRLVTPGVWKRRANLLGKPKDASRALALTLYPEMSLALARKKDNGRAEALLIARFGADLARPAGR